MRSQCSISNIHQHFWGEQWCVCVSSFIRIFVCHFHSHSLVYDQCLSEANLCQAVKNFSLALICSLCDDNDTVLWYFSPGSQKDIFHNLSQKNKTLFLAAVNVTRERASGCYQCLCQGSELNAMYFSVQVELPGVCKHQ